VITPPGAGDALSLLVNNQIWTGWQRVAVTRSMDTVPANFDIQVTEKYPLAPDISIKPGDPCQVKIGNDLVITGYVDRYAAALSPHDHTVRIAGRSKSEDLVDCAAFLGSHDNPGFQVKGGSALSIAQQLAAQYGVTISSIAGPGKQIPYFSINYGETAWEIIDRLTRTSQLVAYDMPDGSVVMAQAGSQTMASGFSQGDNIEQADVTYTMDERYSEYEASYLSTQVYFTDTGQNQPVRGKIVLDDKVPRFRKRYVVSEQTDMGHPIADDRAQWECNRRAGRSLAVNIVCDSWRDINGGLWAPNHLAPIKLPELKLPTDVSWLIAQITYVRDENGQHALLTLMPPSAFDPEPVVLQPLPPMVADVTGNNPAARTGSGRTDEQ
jgi:prophage tail gpP-like protein